MKKIITLLMLATLITTSCDKYLDVNINVDAPDRIEAHQYLAGILSSYQGAYWDIRALGPLTQMMGTSGYQSYASNYYSAGSDAAAEVWRMTYWMQGMNLENLIKQAEDAENWTLAGIGYTIKAYSWDMMAKLQVDLPLEDAYKPGLLAHRYDYQDKVYEAVRGWASKAIECFQKEDLTVYGNKISSTDIVFQGDKVKWEKFAHGVIVRNLASLSNKKDFTSKYADELIQHAALAMTSTSEDASVKTLGGAGEAQFSTYNNFWGTWRSNLSNSYWQHDYAVQVFTGTVPKYDPVTGDKTRITDEKGVYYPFELADNQIICDTIKTIAGHFDPRVLAKLATESDPYYKFTDDKEKVKYSAYVGSGFTGSTGSIATAPNFYGRTGVVSNSKIDGIGRWLYRDNAPYILMTAAEVKFCLAEAYFKKGDKANALQAWKEGVALDMQFTVSHLTPGKYAGLTSDGKEQVGGGLPGGDKVTKAVFNELATEYLAGPYVDGITSGNLTLSHIMMQKWVALYPWGASEAWTDMRKYHYDIEYTGDYPSLDNGWTAVLVNQKLDTDPNKVYKGFYLTPAQVEGRRGKYNVKNEGSPCYRIRPRYNSEYMWNKPSLDALQPISGLADNYHCSIPWFAYPEGYPQN